MKYNYQPKAKKELKDIIKKQNKYGYFSYSCRCR